MTTQTPQLKNIKVIENKANKALSLMIYGEIVGSSGWNWSEQQTDSDVCKQINQSDAETIEVRINSAGGDVFAGFAIYNCLKQHAAHKKVYVDGLAASAASVIAMAGDEIIIPKNGLLMIHNPSTVAWGEAADLRKAADSLDLCKQSIISVYTAKTKLPESTIATMMDEETWMNGDDAVSKGFATHIETKKEAQAVTRSAVFNAFKKTPTTPLIVIKDEATMPPEPQTKPTDPAVTQLLENQQAQAEQINALTKAVENLTQQQAEKQQRVESINNLFAVFAGSKQQARYDALKAEVINSGLSVDEARQRLINLRQELESIPVVSSAAGTAETFDTLKETKLKTGMSLAAAISAVAQERPDLYQAYLEQANGGNA